MSRFEAGATIMLIGDGIAPTADLVARLAEEPEPVVVTVPDDEAHAGFERIDAESRWAGVAVVDAHLLGSTAAMLGDWDLQSTLLRRAIQEGALRLPAGEERGEPILVERPEDLEAFQRKLLDASRGARSDWVSRYLLPPVEEFATEQLMETAVRPGWLIWAALGLTLAARAVFLRGWLGAGLALMILSTPLDIVAARLATLRLRPLAARLREPARARAGRSGCRCSRSPGGRWLLGAAGAPCSARPRRSPSPRRCGVEKAGFPPDADIWLFSRRKRDRPGGPVRARRARGPAYLVALLVYAAASFFIVQHVRHSALGLTQS